MLPMSLATRPLAVPLSQDAKLKTKMLVLALAWIAKPTLAPRPLTSCKSFVYA